MNKLNSLAVGDIYQHIHPGDGKYYLVTGVVCLKGETYIQSCEINFSGSSDFKLPFYLTESMLDGHFKFLFTLETLIEKNQVKLNEALTQFDLANNKYRVMRYSWKDKNMAHVISSYRARLFFFEQLRAVYTGNLHDDTENQFQEFQVFKDKVDDFGMRVHKKVGKSSVQICPNLLCLDAVTSLAKINSTDLTSVIWNYFRHVPNSIDRNRASLVLTYRSVEGFPDLAEYYLMLSFKNAFMPEYLTFKGAKPRFNTELQLSSQHGSLKNLMPRRMNGDAFLLQEWLSTLLEGIRLHHPKLEMVESICEQPKPALPVVKNMQYIFFDLASRLELSEVRFDNSLSQDYQQLFNAILYGEAKQTEYVLQYKDGCVTLPWISTEDNFEFKTVIDLAAIELDEDLLLCDFKLFDLSGNNDVYTKLGKWAVSYLPVFSLDCLVYHKEYKLALDYKADLKKNRDFVTKSINQYLLERQPKLTGQEAWELVIQAMAILEKQFQFKPFTLPEDYSSTEEWASVKQVVDNLLGDSQIPEEIMQIIREKEQSLIDSYDLEAIVYGNAGVSAYFSTKTPDNRMEPYAWVKEFTVKYDSLVSCFKEVDCAVLLQFVKFAYLRNHPDNILGRQQSRFFISSTDKYLTMQYVNPGRVNALVNAFKDMNQDRLDTLFELFETVANDLLNNKVLCDISWFVPYAVIEQGGELYYAGHYNKHFVSMLGQYSDRLNINKEKLLNILDGIYGMRLATSMDEDAIQDYLLSLIEDNSGAIAHALIRRDDYIPLTAQNYQANVLMIPQTVSMVEVDYDFFFLDTQNTIMKPGYYATDLPKNQEIN